MPPRRCSLADFDNHRHNHSCNIAAIPALTPQVPTVLGFARPTPIPQHPKSRGVNGPHALATGPGEDDDDSLRPCNGPIEIKGSIHGSSPQRTAHQYASRASRCADSDGSCSAVPPLPAAGSSRVPSSGAAGWQHRRQPRPGDGHPLCTRYRRSTAALEVETATHQSLS